MTDLKHEQRLKKQGVIYELEKSKILKSMNGAEVKVVT